MGLNPSALYFALVQDMQDAGIAARQSLHSCISAREAAAFNMKASFLKKFEEYDADMRSKADELAITKFLSINDRCGSWRRDHRDTLYLDCLVGYFKDEVSRFFSYGNCMPVVSTFEEILQSARCGPGAALGSLGNDFYTKMFSSDLCSTGRALEYAFLHYFRLSPLWSDAEKFRQDHGFKYRVVPGNRLTTVPKNVDISRVIAVEPNLNMFYQLGLAEILTDRLKKVYSIDLSSQQSVNRELARLGSLGADLCTIDLESASDSMPWAMIQEYLPRNIVAILKLLRSPRCTLPDGRQVELKMISTMGNGFTFPLQTIVFSCVISACYRYLSYERPRAGESWSVFGDDIICPATLAGPVVHLLEHLGFTVNMQKSFFEGPFRESCGSDYFNGQNVRGVYVKHITRPQSRYAVINQLNLWSARTGIPVSKTVKMLLRTVRYYDIPPWENEDAGIRVPYSMVKEKKLHPGYQSILYRRYQVRPLTIRFGEGVVNVPKGHRKRIFNPSGIFLGMLNGSIESGEINVRHDTNLYRSCLAIAPNWDQSPTVPSIADGFSWQQWETAVRKNLL